MYRLCTGKSNTVVHAVAYQFCSFDLLNSPELFVGINTTHAVVCRFNRLDLVPLLAGNTDKVCEIKFILSICGGKGIDMGG